MVKKNLILFSSISGIIVVLDQLTKFLLLNYKPNWNFGWLSIHFVTNTGAGFGILKGQTVILALISFIVALAIIFNYKKIPQRIYPQVLFSLLLGGVIGNFIDRAFRSYVIDFIDLSFWPAFNIADSAITIAAIGLIFYYWKE